jgi:probable HAF family extracellular repeat protein
MRSTRSTWIAGTVLFATLAVPVQISAGQQRSPAVPHYIVTDLGTLGGTFSVAYGVSSAGRVGGGATLAGGNQHPFLWYRGRLTDLGTLGGPNGNAGGPNGRDELPVLAETAAPDPSGEDFCGFGTHLTCLGAVWSDGLMTPLPTLGGNNGQAFALNNRGQVIGVAENSARDPSSTGNPGGCPAPQVFDYEAVIWEPAAGQIQELPPLPGDTVGFALGLNDKGEAVGSSGFCANTPLVPLAAGPHAVLWQNGSPIDLGNLGGKLLNVAAAINNRGEVVGTSDLPGDTADPAFLWTKEAGMRSIGTLGMDKSGLPGGFGGINENGQVVGASCSGYAGSGNCRAFLWQDEVMSDLNTLTPVNSPLYLVFAFAINDAGEIAGLGLTSAGAPHAFLATPTGAFQ